MIVESQADLPVNGASLPLPWGAAPAGPPWGRTMTPCSRRATVSCLNMCRTCADPLGRRSRARAPGDLTMLMNRAKFSPRGDTLASRHHVPRGRAPAGSPRGTRLMTLASRESDSRVSCARCSAKRHLVRRPGGVPQSVGRRQTPALVDAAGPAPRGTRTSMIMSDSGFLSVMIDRPAGEPMTAEHDDLSPRGRCRLLDESCRRIWLHFSMTAHDPRGENMVSSD
jgi:hypothetical protein